MDRASLVTPFADEGRRFVSLLKKKGLPIGLAGWFRLDDMPQAELFIASPDVQAHGPADVIAFVEDSLAEAQVRGFDLGQIWVVNTSTHPINGLSWLEPVGDDEGMRILPPFPLDETTLEAGILYENDPGLRPSPEPPPWRTRARRAAA